MRILNGRQRLSVGLPRLPDGWAWAKLADLASPEKNSITDGPFGSKLKTEHYTDQGPRVVRLQNIGDGVFRRSDAHISQERFDSLQKHCLYADDLVVAALGEALPRACVVPSWLGPAIVKADCIRFKPEPRLIESQFACFALNSEPIRRRTAQIVHGVGRPRLNLQEIKEIFLPVAPLAEQRRIVERIEQLFSELDAGVAALERARANLKRYRASVLKAAVDGSLTAAWRAEHAEVEPASKLLERILAERRRKWETDQLAKFRAAGKEPPKNWRANYVEPAPPNTADVPTLPDSWCWASVQQVGQVQLGRQRAPQHHHGPHMHPYLRVANVFEDRIDINDVMEMNFTPQEFETYRLTYGDILLNEGQSMELVGRPAMFRDEVPGACFTNTLVRFRAMHGVESHYALKVFLAYLKNGRFQKIATVTVNIAHLGAGRFSEVEFPLPPEAEQAAIVAEVDRHLSRIEAAERLIEQGLTRAARLRQSILKQAFEGKLVAQDAADEPAAELLARIQRERTAQTHRATEVVKLPKDVFMRRAALVTYTVQRLWQRPTFGRTQLEKAMHLGQCHVGVDLRFTFERQVAGPFDKAIYKLEGVARKNGWFSTHKRPKCGVTYRPGAKADAIAKYTSGYGCQSSSSPEPRRGRRQPGRS